jgi:hypothetical protein
MQTEIREDEYVIVAASNVMIHLNPVVDLAGLRFKSVEEMNEKVMELLGFYRSTRWEIMPNERYKEMTKEEKDGILKEYGHRQTTWMYVADAVDMDVNDTPQTEEIPEDTLKKWPVGFSISSEELLAKFELGKNRQHSTLPAITLTPTCLSDRFQSGWTVSGEVNGDAGYFWVNEFHAKHPKYGRVYGNLEKTVYYTSDEGLEDFINTYKVCIEFWDYGDI